MEKQVNVYLCYTVMHVYVSILKTWNSSDCINVLVLTDHINGVSKLHRKVANLHLFDKIISVPEKEIQGEYFKKNVDFFFYNKKLTSIYNDKYKINKFLNDFNKRDIHIYTFLDQTRISQYFIINYFNIYLIEDGLSLYRRSVNPVKEFLKYIVFKVPKSYGYDRRVKRIEATSPDKLPIKVKGKAARLNLDLLVQNISPRQKDILVKLFIGEINNISKETKNLVLTGPYSDENIISEEYQIKLYTKIINQFKEDATIYFKPHPRDTIKYQFNKDMDVVILESNFPIEILDILIEAPFRKTIALDSSSINNLNCSNEKINLGLDYDSYLYEQYHRKY